MVCAIVTGIPIAVAPGYSYLDLQKKGFGGPDSTAEERQPFVQDDGADVDADAEEAEEPAEAVNEADTEGIV